MDMQLDFFGRPSVRDSNSAVDAEHRYYFTLLPPPALAQDIERGARILARRHNSRQPTRADRLHVSLNGVHMGEPMDTGDIEDAMAVGAAIRRPSFDLAFDRVQTFGRARGAAQFPVVLSSSQPDRELDRLYGDIFRAMQSHGMRVGPRSIEPHMTIFYASERVPDIVMRRPFRWRVSHFWLLHTVRGHRNPEILGEWALGGL
ncbi:2'-5' RNA ligase family protein [Devosia sp.]|uniref:2'-5' RNA ligase family protein n=1 Tax=Devosia sp. TaxID=1871048 RepID=UPI003267B243